MINGQNDDGKMKRVKSFLSLALTSLLLVACLQNNEPTSNPTPSLSKTSILSPVPTNTLEMTATPAVLSITPLVTAPYIEFGSWSPDSQWIAYWVSSQEDMEQPTNFMPGGTLNFRNVASGETCSVSQLARPDSQAANVYWSEGLHHCIWQQPAARHRNLADR
jgi:hypothetical protein